MLWCGAWWPTSGSRPLPLPINCATLALPCVLLFALLLFFVCVYVPFVFGNAIKALVGPRAWMGRRLVGQLLAVVSMWPGTRAPKQPQCVQLLRRTSQEYNQPTNKHKMEKKINEEEAAHTHYIPTCGHFNIIILDACAACFSRLLVCNFSIWFPIHSANKTNRMWHVCVCVTLNTLRSSDSDAVKILWRKKKWIAEQSVPRITIFIYRCLF